MLYLYLFLILWFCTIVVGYKFWICETCEGADILVHRRWSLYSIRGQAQRCCWPHSENIWSCNIRAVLSYSWSFSPYLWNSCPQAMSSCILLHFSLNKFKISLIFVLGSVVTTSMSGWLRGSSWLFPITYGDMTLSLNEISRLCLHALLNCTCLALSYHNCKGLHD